jgi:1-acyl-sn-glycerol-3-phosphate acyltransferase
MTGMGCVEGTRENCTQLMKLGEQILVFPGGGGEVFKRKGEQYRLRWKERVGFARMAIENRCPIIPFAAVGGDDFYKIVLGSDEIMATPVGKLLVKAGLREEALGVYRGVGLSMIPRPQRLYFKFGKPIRTTRYKGDGETLVNCEAVRDEVKASVESMIAKLLEQRERDPKRHLARRLLGKLTPRGLQ